MLVKVRPAKRLTGTVTLPGDKSISHRAAMLAAIAAGTTTITNFATSRDCASTLECLGKLGVAVERTGKTVVVHGVGKAGLRPPDGPLDCGNSGTTMRLMAGILAGQRFSSTLTGDASLRGRPMGRIIEPLGLMGAEIVSSDGDAPITIKGGRPLNGIKYVTPVASAQIKSCVLLAGLFADGGTTVIEQTPTRDHTERMLRGFGVDLSIRADEHGRHEIMVSGNSELAATEIDVPADISSAAFFLVAAACLPGSELRLEGVGVNPTRATILDVLSRLGARMDIEESRLNGDEPAARLVMRGGLDRPAGTANVLGGELIAGLIDELPILGVLGTQIEGGLEVRDAAELRIKESDRIMAVTENLRRMGALVEERSDGFRVAKSNLNGARVDSFGDHRIAMAFAVAGLVAEGETEITGAECVDVSFPGFFDVIDEIAQRQ